MNKNTKKWKIIASSVAGPSHINRGKKCEDYYSYFSKGENFIAIISDGAGSKDYGKIGAKIICDSFIDIFKKTTFKNAEEKIIKAIKLARKRAIFHRMNKTKSSGNLSDFSATVLGVMMFKNKGYFFHIGDGAAISFNHKELNNFNTSMPHNGNYSNETFFYTMKNWEKHLRITPIENYNRIILMSDGVSNFAFKKKTKKLEDNFIVPINDFLSNAKLKSKARAALKNTLNNKDAKKLSSDDKTLLWAKYE
jgi:serine/threonine protein phosphatase PrpC